MPQPAPTPVPPDEAFLLARARRQDADAFEALYRAHHRRVYALLLRMCTDPVLADEMTQDTFVQAWKGLRKFRGASNFGTWLHAIAVRVCLNTRRSERRHDHRDINDNDTDTYAFAAKRAMPETQIDLERALAALPNRAREVIVLYDVYGYRHGEIGDLLGIAEGTSKAQLHRARGLMREALER